MSQYAAFRRQPVPGQVAQAQKTITIPAPTRGIVLDENEAFMQPGACIVSENWIPTLRGMKLRGGSVVWSTLPAAVISGFEYNDGDVEQMFAATATTLYDVTGGGAPITVKAGQTSGNYSASQMATVDGNDWLIAVNETGDVPLRMKNGASWIVLDPTTITAWANNTHYAVGATAKDTTDFTYWKNQVDHTSATSGTFAADRTVHLTYWTANSAPDGGSWITGMPGAPAPRLSYIWKYRNRFFFIEPGTMNAWYLPINSIGGSLSVIPLSGSATRGGKLVAGATWSVDTGSGTDDKCVFISSEGELLIYTGSNPGDSANWRQEGRYQISPPMGMNALLSLGGDLLIATVDGIVPISQAIAKDAQQLELAMLTRPIKPLWRETVNAKSDKPWSIKKWDQYGGIFVATPGGSPGDQNCLAANDASGAWTRISWDATCFMIMRGNMYFGRQDGKIMQADRTGYDDGVPYVCTFVGGWEMFQSHSQQVVWHQARAIFKASGREPFIPQITATTDFRIVIPQPPPAGRDLGPLDVWDQGFWGPGLGPAVPSPWANATLYNVIGTTVYDLADGVRWNVAVSHTSAATGTFADDRAAPGHSTYWTSIGVYPPPPVPTTLERDRYAQWDQPAPGRPSIRNTMWVSVGMLGFSHAPVVQVTVAQQSRPDVELIAIAATFEQAGVTV